jgi:hypothetical protein
MKRILVGLLVLAAGCRDATSGDVVVVEGRLSLGFETASFRPCQSTENWLPLLTERMRARYDSAAGAPYANVFARLRGGLGPRGLYGHKQANDHQFRVVEVLELRRTAERDCPNS